MRSLASLLPICVLLAACGDGPREAAVHRHPGATDAAPAGGSRDAIAVMQPTAGNRVAGVLRFREREGKVVISGDVTGLTANGRHAIHIHEYGDASSADGAAAGGHYNPEGHPHGGLDHPHRHAGDLGNLLADAAGASHVEISVDNLTVAGARNPLIGRAVVIHAGTDDLVSQPAGNAGPRIAVGVIGIAKPVVP
jgi:Cu-Zn family superoxide dismutase